jgi:glycosyltransferase involved in cell wall biosynthesis
VAICIATYRRPEGLRTLLASLNDLRFEGPAPGITVIVADNAPEAPATGTLGDVAALCRWPLIYVVEGERGIVAARNRLLSLAGAEADFVAFVDDDETVSPHWLAALLDTQARTSATVVQGVLDPVFDAPPPGWVEDLRLFHLGPFEQDQSLSFAGAGNCLIKVDFLRKTSLRFDPRFNLTGGEDEELFWRLQRAGGKIHAASDALVVEAVPANRARLSWLMRRTFRKGNTLGRIALIHRQGRLPRFAKGVGAMLRGAAGMILRGPVSRAGFYAGLLEAARGAGMLAAFLRLDLSEYNAAALSRDRGTGA